MKTGNFINGKWESSADTFASICPEDGAVLGDASRSSAADVAQAVAAAKAALPAWSGMSLAARAQYVMHAAELLAKQYGSMGQPTPLKELIVKEMGKRLPEADIEVAESSDMLRFFAEQGPRCLEDRPIALDHALWPTKKSTLSFHPLGVVAVIKPWNYPLELPVWSIGAALVAGNTVVFKPSELTPFVATELVRLFEQADLPPGVLNMVTGDAATGASLVDSPDVDMVSFTGSIPVGHEVALKCASRSCRVSLELGGKDAMIVLPDADLDLTVNGALWGAFTNCGQVCVGVRRILIPQPLWTPFVDRFVECVKQLKLGRDIGPLASAQQRRRVERHVLDAKDKGARILAGAGMPTDTAHAKGFYYLPTVLADTGPNMLVEKDDTFGPVVTVRSYSSEDEAVHMANDVRYDLGASVWTRDERRGLEMASRLNCGMVWINDVNVAFPQAPWCGRRWSGHGIELSEFSFYDYTTLKHLNIETGSERRRAWWFPYA